MAGKPEPKKEPPKTMTKRLLVILICVIAGGYFFLSKFEVKQENSQWIIRSRDRDSYSVSHPEKIKPNIPMPPLRPGRGDQIQIATFNVGPLDDAKFASDAVLEHLAYTIGNFDLVALQDIRVRDPGKLGLIIKKLAAKGRNYESVVSPSQTADGTLFNAFIFDRASVEVDRDFVFSLNEPHGRLRIRPISALFRVRGPSPNQAFTFVAINVHVNPNEREAELDLLPDVLDTVKKYYPEEDDLILLASLQASPEDFGALGEVPGIRYAAEDRTSLIQENYLAENVLFDRYATVEYTGDWGVLDFTKPLGLTPEQALRVSQHLPVWAKFSVYEGGR